MKTMNLDAAEALGTPAQATPPNPMGGANTDVQPAPAKDPQISSKLSILMERERQALTREQRAKAQEEALKERLSKIDEFENAKKTPLKALELLGYDYNQLTESMLKEGEVPPSVQIKQLNDRIDELTSQLKQKEERQAESEQRKVSEAETRALNDFRMEINDHLKQNSERYELIAFEEAQDFVFDIINEHYNRTIDPETGIGKVMPISEAADKAEEYLEKKYLAAREKNKVKAFWTNMPKGVQAQFDKQKQSLNSQTPRTLTNNLGPKTSGVPKRPPEDQRIAAILADFQANRRSQFAG